MAENSAGTDDCGLLWGLAASVEGLGVDRLRVVDAEFADLQPDLG